ncbi:MAG: DUF3791 domain-containing protein [Erysipelotrichaceae bacterium]
MSEKQKDIVDMECWVFRMAQEKWNKSSKECADVFRQYNVLSFISDCYDFLHLNSYERALGDVEKFIQNKGGIL